MKAIKNPACNNRVKVSRDITYDDKLMHLNHQKRTPTRTVTL